MFTYPTLKDKQSEVIIDSDVYIYHLICWNLPETNLWQSKQTKVILICILLIKQQVSIEWHKQIGIAIENSGFTDPTKFSLLKKNDSCN